MQRLEFYSVDDLTHIVKRSASLMDVPMTEDGAKEIARRSRGTPRIANVYYVVYVTMLKSKAQVKSLRKWLNVH